MKESLYRRIARELAQQILSGQYPVGSLLPTEMALCEHYQVSRHTMREAPRDLTKQRLITRRKGSGTQVADKAQHKGLNYPLACLEDLFFLAKNNPHETDMNHSHVSDTFRIQPLYYAQYCGEIFGQSKRYKL
ncbi:MAG: GntR family transcriptional regulator [Symbiopectobacterium sp.]|uniref:GntR family transcriptional regulator n=1 Tax=Symbiopectobacterium sp. TaxID=2952789 RepID=UPI003F36B868